MHLISDRSNGFESPDFCHNLKFITHPYTWKDRELINLLICDAVNVKYVISIVGVRYTSYQFKNILSFCCDCML
jgi:hypothetical protein